MYLTHVVFRGFNSTSNGPISSKFPYPVDDAPGPPYKNVAMNNMNSHYNKT